jgi:hypothetical protein
VCFQPFLNNYQLFLVQDFGIEVQLRGALLTQSNAIIRYPTLGFVTFLLLLLRSFAYYFNDFQLFCGNEISAVRGLWRPSLKSSLGRLTTIFCWYSSEVFVSSTVFH